MEEFESLFGCLEPRGSRDKDKKLISKLASTPKKTPSSVKGSNLNDKMEWIRREVDTHLNFLSDKVESCRTYERLTRFFDNFVEQEKGAIDTETLGLDYFKDNIYGWSAWAKGEKSIYVPVLHHGYVTGQRLENQVSVGEIKTQLERVVNSNVRLVFHNAKFDLHMLYHNFGVMLPCWWDTMIASRLLHSSEKDHSLKYQYSVKVKGEDGKPYDFKSLFEGVEPNTVPIDIMTKYAAGDTFETLGLQEYQEEEFKKYPGIYNVFTNIEMPLLPIVVEMEETGVAIDFDMLNKMDEKYTKRLEDAKSDCYKELEKYRDKINTFRLRNSDKLSDPINLSSPAQMAIILYDIIGIEETKKYGRGTGKQVLELLKGKSVFCKKLLEVREAEKLINAFIKSIPTYIKPDGRVHSDFVQIKGTGNTTSEDEDNGADTGRFSCIAEGQYVQVVNGQKKIEEIEVGDYVYCYDDNGNIHLSKVKNVFDNGIRDCVEIVWQSTGKHCSGSLVCTSDHRIRTKSGEWVQAKDLKRYNKLSHIRRGIGEQGRPRIYGSNSFMDLEHNIIKRDYFKCGDNKMHIHHIDGNKSNNSLENLELMTHEEHSRLHAIESVRRGVIPVLQLHSEESRRKASETYKKVTLERISKEKTIELLLENNGSPTKCGYDYSTILRRIKEYNIDMKSIKEKCKGLDEDNFTKVFFEEKGMNTKIASRLHISSDKAKMYIKKYNLCYNHMVQSIKPVGKRHVYDLEVEKYHNFIVSEICVHNCKDPNLQQIPSRGEKSELRKIFKATDGYIMMSSDYSQQEPRLLAHCSGDHEMKQAYIDGKDLYALMASKIYKKPYEECKEFYPDGTLNKEGKARRSATKAVLLG